MPELPEVETIARALDKALRGKCISKVESFCPRLRTSLAPLVAAKLEGHTFTNCRRRARYAVAALDDGRQLVLHFGMTGVVRVEKATVPHRKHEHLFIHLTNGEALRYEDPRRFGSVEIDSPGVDGWPQSLASIGVEPLSAAFNTQYLFKESRGRTLPVKEFIMDNKVVTGIGNIYAAETLFASQVLPTRKASTLTEDECALIVRNAKRILRLAIKWGGSTISDYRHVDGSQGKFAQRLKIYAHKECPQCGGATSKVVLGGRTSWFCPHCQH